MKRLIFILFGLILFWPCAANASPIPADHFAGAFAHPRVSGTKISAGFGAEVDAEPQAGGGGHSVTLTCTAGVPTATMDAATSFNFKRSTTSGGPYTTIGNSPTSCSFTDTGVVAGAKYFYVATGVNSGGESLPTNEVPATIPFFPPPTPSGLAATPK